MNQREGDDSEKRQGVPTYNKAEIKKRKDESRVPKYSDLSEELIGDGGLSTLNNSGMTGNARTLRNA